MSTPSRKGLSAVAASAERLDEVMRSLREGSRSIVEVYADLALGRSSVVNGTSCQYNPT
jgi:hypothetical protein